MMPPTSLLPPSSSRYLAPTAFSRFHVAPRGADSSGSRMDKSTDEETHSASRQAKRVLIIDDDGGMRDSLAMVLENEGLESAVARNGAEALESLGRSKRLPDLIILDLMMPIMNGWDFRSAQLADPRLAAIPTLVLTADTDASLQAEEFFVSECLRKPIDIDALLASVAGLIPDWHPET